MANLILPSVDRLTGRDNYNEWAFAMQAYLEHEDLWSCVLGNDSTTDANEKLKRDKKAKAKIIMMVHNSSFIHITNAKTTKEVWDNLKTAYQDSGLTRKVGLMRKLITTKLEDHTSMEEYISAIISTAQKLNNINFEVSSEWVATFLLAGLSENYAPMIMALESSGTTITADYVKTKLLQETNPLAVNGKESAAFQSRIKPNKNKSKIRCYNCNNHGHYASECKKPNKKYINKKAEKSLLAFHTHINKSFISDEDWFIDSGASSHMCCNRHQFVNIKKTSQKREVILADGRKISVQYEGNCELIISLNNKDIPIKINNVLYVPELSSNLLSISQIVKSGKKIIFKEKHCDIFDEYNNLIATATLCGDMYRLNLKRKEKLFYVEEKVIDWHRRLGHISDSYLKRLEKIYNCKMTEEKQRNEKCVICLKGKHAKSPFTSSASSTKSKLELIHADLCGPMEIKSIGGSRYFFILIDDYTHKIFVYFLKSKDEVFETFKNFKNLVENQCEKKIKIFRTDNGGEFISNRLAEYLKSQGIIHQTSISYNPQQNGVAERANRTVIEKARCLLIDAQLPKKFWAEAVNTAVYLLNRSPTIALKNMVPEQAWTNKLPDLADLQIFGSEVMVQIPKEKRRKLDEKSEEGILVGYLENQKGYRIYNKIRNQVFASRDVIFIRNSDQVRETQLQSSNQSPLILDNDLENVNSVGDNESIHSFHEQTPEEYLSPIDLSPERRTMEDLSNYSEINQDSQLVEKENLQKNLRRSKREHKINHLPDFLYKVSVEHLPDPISLEEAMNRPDANLWKKAMEEEFYSLMENNTWSLTQLPSDKRALPCKWVFKTKKSSDGTTRYKARLVIKGCSQSKGIDYEETFSPVVKYDTLRYLFALATIHDLDIDQMDAITAFLQGDLKESIFMEQPESFKMGKGVCKLNKAIYGLKQASRTWNMKLHKVLTELGLTRSKVDNCVYYLPENKSKEKLFIAIYVDDLIIFSSNESIKSSIKTNLKNNLKLKDMGEIKNFLGLRITRDRKAKKLWIDQQEYIQQTLGRFNMLGCNPVATPCESNIKLSTSMCPEKDKEKEDMKNVPYQEAVGSLLYISQCTRPDITFSVNKVSRYCKNPGKEHWTAVKRIFKYLKGTMEFKLEYTHCENDNLYGYCDADFASDVDKRKSTTGYIFYKGKSAISWNTKKQQTTALSTTEAEYMSLSAATQEAVWLKGLEEEILGKQNSAITIYCDNHSAINLASNNVYHSRTKHIDVRHHFVKEKVAENIIKVLPVSSRDMIADLLTKGLSKELHQLHCKNLNLKQLI